MITEITVNLGDILLALSDALDLASPALAQHQQRVAYIAWRMAKTAKLSGKQIEKIFITAILHDVGALTPEEKIDLHESEFNNVEQHCIMGGRLFDQIPWLKSMSPIIQNHHKKWEEYESSLNDQNVLESQIINLADTVERYIDRKNFILYQEDQLYERIKAMSGISFHPMVIDLFKEVSDSEEFWLDLMSPRLFIMLKNGGPHNKIELDLDDTHIIAQLFRNIIDFRSHYTATHSSGVAACAAKIAGLYGYTETEIELMEVAGFMHDIGKMIVPNAILEKPAKLTKDEYAVIRQHTYYTYAVLKNIRGLESIVDSAAFHHEKLDGSGYPFRIQNKHLSTGARILAVCDIFTALAEDRPYREGMPKSKLIGILNTLANQNHIDVGVVAFLLGHYDDIYHHVLKSQKQAEANYKQFFNHNHTVH